MRTLSPLLLIAVLVLASCGNQTALVPTAVPQKVLMTPTHEQATPVPASTATVSAGTAASQQATPFPATRIPSLPDQHATSTAIAQTQLALIVPSATPLVQVQPNTSAVTAFTFLDAQHGWLGDGTNLLATRDGGKQWAKLATMPQPVDALSFVSTMRGWAIVAGGLLATRDGGATWSAVATPGGTHLSQVDFVDARHGWVRALRVYPQALFRTTDGGATWMPAVEPCGLKGQLNFVSPQVGWAMCAFLGGTQSQGKELVKTVDGGQHWSSLMTSDETNRPHRLPSGGYLTSTFFLDKRHGWISVDFASIGMMLATADGGRTWDWNGLGEAHQDFLALQYMSPTQGYMIGSLQGGPSALLATTRGGTALMQLYPPLRPLGHIAALHARRAVAIGSVADLQALLVTSDGGRTWQQTGTLANACSVESIRDVIFSDLAHGSVQADCSEDVGSTSYVLQTDDGGLHWRKRPLSEHMLLQNQ